MHGEVLVSTKKQPTLYDVAKVAGVSHQTVSRLLRGYSGIREETAARVHAAIDELGYRTNVTARNLRNGTTDTIALAIPDLSQPYFAELAQAVMDAARQVGLTVFVETTGGDPARELAMLDATHSRFVDGVIFAPKTITADDLAKHTVTVPMVLIGDRILDQAFDHVTLPNRAGTRAAVQHLIDTGRHRIGFIGAEAPSDVGAAHLRLAGYRDALESAGIGFDPDLVIYDGEWLRETGSESMRRLIESGTTFDGVFCCNDALAIGALRETLAHGLSVPGDVAIVGFDDTEDVRFTYPSLTSVSPGREQLVRQAVDLLHKRIQRLDGADAPQDIVSDFSLSIRESTAISAS